MVYDQWDTYSSNKHNLSGLFAWERSVISSHFSDCKNILVGAAGGGREVLALSQSGFQVDGFDCFQEFVDSANALFQSQAVPTQLILAEPDHVPVNIGVYNGAIIGWSGYSHIAGRERRVNYLKEFHQHLHPGSPLLLSYFSRPEDSLFYKIIVWVANGIKWIRRSSERVDFGDSLPDAFFHFATYEEVKAELVAAGFEPVYHSAEGFEHSLAYAV
jgi:hypothetical protein